MGSCLGKMLRFTDFLIVSVLLVSFVNSQCEISVKNVGHNDFTWHLDYNGDYIHEKNLTYGEHDNYECACVNHNMKIMYQDYYCYHYMNCIHNFDYEVDITDYAIYINVGHDNVEICPL